MKKIVSIVLLLSGLSFYSIAEKGMTITQKVTTGNGKSQITVTWYVTQDQCKMKMEYSDNKVKSVNWFIPDVKGGKLLMYGEGAVPPGTQKAYYAIPVHDINTDKSMNPTRVKIQKTGETKTIAGLLCEKIIARSNKTNTEMWVTTTFKPAFYSFYPFFQDSYELMALSEENISGFPVSSITTDLSGRTISSYEPLTTVTTELSESDFHVPADYKSSEEITKGK